jgi:hypothetical protein
LAPLSLHHYSLFFWNGSKCLPHLID